MELLRTVLFMISFCVLSLLALATSVIIRCRWTFGSKRKSNVVAFFHPYCSAGGGGERVLWKIVEILAEIRENQQSPPFDVVIYTIDPPSSIYQRDLFEHVQERFSIHPSPSLPISFVHLDGHRHFLAKSSRFSLAAESFGTMRLAYKALAALTPCVFFDTTGCAFTYFVARVLAGCRVCAYVHYPTISTDMLSLVWERRRASYNHDDAIVRNRWFTFIKLVYYVLFALAYGMVGSLSHLVLVNSTWTWNHIRSLWFALSQNRLRIVFPPCNVQDLHENLPNSSASSSASSPLVPRYIVSIGQFRPEKDHVLQLESLACLFQKHPQLKQESNIRLILVGSCRNEQDRVMVMALRKLCRSLELDDSVEFVLNQPYSAVQEWLGRATIGIHTMWNEHFGIGVVEMMAAGLIVVAHNSGGPKTDIVQPGTTGFLASTKEEYAQAIHEALDMPNDKALEMREAARKSAMRFSDQVFVEAFKQAILESGILPG